MRATDFSRGLYPRLRGLLGLAALAIGLLGTACTEDSDDLTGSDPDPPADVSGSYALSGVRSLTGLNGGGSGLPVTFTDDAGAPLTFQEGVLSLGMDGSFSLFIEATFGDTEVELTDEGTYTRAGNSLVFTSTADPQRLSTGALAGEGLTAQSQFGGFQFEIDMQKQ